MKLTQIKIENFRSYKDRTTSLGDYACLVGPNGGGKSTLLIALNVFFRSNVPNHNLVSLVREDFHHGNTNDPIKITLTFENLSEKAQEDFKDYYRQGKLVISAIARWDETSQKADVIQYGSRLVMNDFKPYFAKEKDGEKAEILRKVYKELGEKYSDLPKATSKPDMYEALRSYEENHPKLCELALSNDQFYGYTKGADRLPKYVQWVYIPAVKDASSEQDESKKTAIGQLLERTVRSKVDFKERIDCLKEELAEKYATIIESEKGALKELSMSLKTRLQEWSHPGVMLDLHWDFDKEKSVTIDQPYASVSLGEDKFMGEVSRLGHGLQRSFLATILQELSSLNDEFSPRLILGFEEPEIFQHPPQERHIASLLEELSNHNSQIIITTHSPHFVPGKGFENVRMIRKDKKTFESLITHLTVSKLEKILSEALGETRDSPTSMVATIEQIMQPSLKELFFTPNIILVEGIEDIALISTYFKLLNCWSEFRKYGCHFIVTAGKTNMSRPLAIANAFEIPTFAVFDGDGECKKEKINPNKRDNSCLLRLCGIDEFDPLSKETIWEKNVIMWPVDIGNVVKASFNKEAWGKADLEVRKKNGWEEVRKKNGLLIAATLEKLWNEGQKSEILEKLCQRILDFAKSGYSINN